MSAPLFLLPSGTLCRPDTVPGSRLVLDGAEGHHAADVVRLQPGEPVRLADGSGRLAECTVTHVGRGELHARVDQLLDEPVPAPSFTLVQALAKGDRDLLGIEVATELGVDHVVPWAAQRSVVVWRSERAAKAHAKWQRTLLAATKQARRTRVPDLAPLADLSAVGDRVAGATLALVLHEEATTALVDLPLPEDGEVVLVVGPEGGISPEETRALAAAGGHVVRLGSTVLRTSTAGSAALATLLSRTRWL